MTFDKPVFFNYLFEERKALILIDMIITKLIISK